MGVGDVACIQTYTCPCKPCIRSTLAIEGTEQNAQAKVLPTSSFPSHTRLCTSLRPPPSDFLLSLFS
eukprot:1158976-Pelagomonas_calceolata.AAC.5